MALDKIVRSHECMDFIAEYGDLEQPPKQTPKKGTETFEYEDDCPESDLLLLYSKQVVNLRAIDQLVDCMKKS